LPRKPENFGNRKSKMVILEWGLRGRIYENMDFFIFLG